MEWTGLNSSGSKPLDWASPKMDWASPLPAELAKALKTKVKFKMDWPSPFHFEQNGMAWEQNGMAWPELFWEKAIGLGQSTSGLGQSKLKWNGTGPVHPPSVAGSKESFELDSTQRIRNNHSWRFSN